MMNEGFDLLDELALILALDPLDPLDDAALDHEDATTIVPAALRSSVLDAARARRPAGEATGTDHSDMTPAQAYGASHRFETRRNERGGFSVIVEIPYETGDKA